MKRWLAILIISVCIHPTAIADQQDGDVPDLSKYDADTLRILAGQLYRRVATLEDQVATLKQELRSLEDKLEASIRVEGQARDGKSNGLPSDDRHQRLEAFVAEAKEKRVAEIEHSLSEARMRLRQNRSDQQALQRVKDLQKSLSAAQSDNSTRLPDLWSTGFQTGRFGRLGRYTTDNTEGRKVKIKQIIDGRQMLVVATYQYRPVIANSPPPSARWSGRLLRGSPVTRETDAVWVRGIDTSGMADGQRLDWEQGPIFEVTGTTTYKTTDGGSATVYVVEPVEP